MILLLNLTVAVGTINGVVFYANILAVSYSTFFYLSCKIAQGFVLILNMEFPNIINFCYVKGLDAYSKIWLRLGFPLYMFLIVFAIIKLCQYSKKFSNLVGKRNPACGNSIIESVDSISRDGPDVTYT